jgi:hypothetical protein
MKKTIFILLIFLGMSQLGAETLFQIYPPSWFGLVSGTNIKYNGFERDEGESIPVTYNFPIEIRQTIVKSSFADLMIACMWSFYSENILISSVNLSGGLTFGYGYDGIKSFFRNTNITIYPIYECPIIFSGTPEYRWKFALDISWELIQLRSKASYSKLEDQISPVSISVYIREIGIYAKNLRWGIPDVGLVLGLIF